jgi:hypothetical protein
MKTMTKLNTAMPLSRRELLLTLPAATLVAQAATNRKALVRRHNPTLTPVNPLSIGNAEFAARFAKLLL